MYFINNFQAREDRKDESINGRTAISIPGDLPSPKSPSAVIEKRHSMRQDAKEQREQYHNRTNNACLNKLILPLLSEVGCLVKEFLLR